MNKNLKSKIVLGFFTTSIFLIGIFSASSILDLMGYEKIVSVNKTALVDSAWQKIDSSSGENYFYFIKNPKYKPAVTAEAYLVGDIVTGDIIIAKNKNNVFPIASVSKLFTALISLEHYDQEQTINITKEILATEGENGGFAYKEKIRLGDLIYPLLLESSNDAAEAIATNMGRPNFLGKVNQKVQDLGMVSTYFDDPSGLSEKNVSTVSDLFLISKYLKEKKPDLLDITTKKSYSNKKHVWFNNSQFLDLTGYEGGKRGYIDESKQTEISFFSVPIEPEDKKEIAIILLRSSDRYADTVSILKYLNKNVYYGDETITEIDWVKQRGGIIEEAEPNGVTFVFGGDLMLDRGVRSSVNKNFNGDYSKLFEKLDILRKADIVFANLEGTASDKGKDLHNLYSFQMDPSVIPALKGAGFSILSMANNHVGDWGRESYEDTLKRLDENELVYTGGGNTSEEAEQPSIIEKYGIKIGFLGFSDVGPSWMNADVDKAGLLLANNPRFEEIIQNASAKVDYLVVSFHFGEEYQTKHNERQEYLAHSAVDNGAKIVIGHHPHVIQDTEIYKNSFIAYSLGNFVFDQRFSADTMQGMLLELKLGKTGDIIITKNIVKLNQLFQPDKLIEGKEEKIIFTKTKVEELSISQ